MINAFDPAFAGPFFLADRERAQSPEFGNRPAREIPTEDFESTFSEGSSTGTSAEIDTYTFPLKTSRKMNDLRGFNFFKIQLIAFCALLKSRKVPIIYQDPEGNQLLFPRNPMDKPVFSSKVTDRKLYKSAYDFFKTVFSRFEELKHHEKDRNFLKFSTLIGEFLSAVNGKNSKRVNNLLLKWKKKEFKYSKYYFLFENLRNLKRKANGKDWFTRLYIIKKTPELEGIHRKIEEENPDFKDFCFRFFNNFLSNPLYLEGLNKRGKSSLQKACDLKNPFWFKFLLFLKIDLNQVDKNGDRALDYVIRKGFKKHVKSLLYFKADPNQHDSNGKTPLQYAIEKKQEEILIALLQAGADPEIRCKEGHSAFYYFLMNKEDFPNVTLVQKE